MIIKGYFKLTRHNIFVRIRLARLASYGTYGFKKDNLELVYVVFFEVICIIVLLIMKEQLETAPDHFLSGNPSISRLTYFPLIFILR